MRVAMIAGASEGADWFAPMCVGMQDRGHDVTAIIDSRPGDLGARLTAAGVRWETADLSLARPLAGRSGPGGYPRDALRLAGAMARLAVRLRRMRVDAVVTQLFNATVVGRVAGVAARVPVRAAMVPSPFALEAPLLGRLDRATARLDTGVIAGSERIRTLYREAGVRDDRIEVVYYGADADRFDPGTADPSGVRASLDIPPAVPLVGHVAHFYAPIDGGMSPPAAQGRGVKGHETLLHAARLVLEQRPDARFALVGGARGAPAQAYRGRLEQLSAQLGLTDAVTFAGERGDVPEVLAALDVAVQPSLAENLGGTVEALLMGVPMVASAVGGMPEAVVHDQTGLLVAPGDPAALAAAILRLLDDPELRARLGAAGRRRMLAGFTAQRTVDDLDALLRRWAGNAGRGAPVNRDRAGPGPHDRAGGRPPRRRTWPGRRRRSQSR